MFWIRTEKLGSMYLLGFMICFTTTWCNFFWNYILVKGVNCSSLQNAKCALAVSTSLSPWLGKGYICVKILQYVFSLSSRSILGIKPSFSMTYRQFWGHRQEDRGDKQTQIREMRKACSPVFTFVLVTLWVCALFISPSICFFISILFFCPLDFGSPDFYLKKRENDGFVYCSCVCLRVHSPP